MQEKLNILFRTAGGQARKKQLGLGHVFRCIHLAHFLKPHKIFFLLEDYGKTKQVFYTNGFKNIFTIQQGIGLNDDIRITRNFITKNKIDIIIFDKYNSNTKYVKSVLDLTKTVVISDLWKINYDADLVVNGFIGFKNKIIFNKLGTKCIIGPQYQILDMHYTQKKKNQHKKYTLLATFGGFDENNLVEILCKALNDYIDKLKLKIIMGPVTPIPKNVKTFTINHSDNVTVMPVTKNMKKEISNTKYGICGGGITSYEFAVMKVPFAIICQSKHQLITASEWEKKGFAINLGLPNRNTPKKIQNFMNQVLQNNFKKPKEVNLIDGKGVVRVANEILKLVS